MISRRAADGATGASREKILRARQLRREMTPSECRLWEALRRKRVGLRVRPQHVILGWIVDFYIARAGMVIEVDGDIHDLQENEDARRTATLEDAGLRVIRVRNEAVWQDLEKVIVTIEQMLLRSATPSPLAPAPRGKGAGG